MASAILIVGGASVATLTLSFDVPGTLERLSSNCSHLPVRSLVKLASPGCIEVQPLPQQ